MLSSSIMKLPPWLVLEVFKVDLCSLKLSFLCRRSLRETKPSMIRREEEWQLEKRSKVEKFSPNEPSPGRVGRWLFSVVTFNLKRKSGKNKEFFSETRLQMYT